MKINGRRMVSSNCLLCGKEHFVRPKISRLGENAGKFCSRKCGSVFVNKKTDRTGMRYGRLVAVLLLPNETKPSGRIVNKWGCVCDCGNFCSANTVALATGGKVSCGCARVESTRRNAVKAAEAARKYSNEVRSSSLFKRWRGICGRVQSGPQSKNYRIYKGKGLKVCEEWHDFYVFKSWAETSGFKKELTIDRIDNSKGYQPDNCRWITMKENLENRVFTPGPRPWLSGNKHAIGISNKKEKE